MKRFFCAAGLCALLLTITGCRDTAPRPLVGSSDADVTVSTSASGTVATTSAGTTATATASSTGTTASTGGTESSSGTTAGVTVTRQTAYSTTTAARTTTATPSPSPAPASEMRGVWMSYIELSGLIGGKTEAQARAALDGMMDRVKACGLNTVIFHVRANSDAYYRSTVFKPAATVKALLESGFDPLGYAVEAAHKRGLRLEAWVNPYRIGIDKSYAMVDDVFTAKNGSYTYYYYNPASLEAQALILRGVAELVNNYAIDGVQFDDYFYPPDTAAVPAKTPAPFEKAAYDAYRADGGTLDIQGWRRAQVDALVAGCYRKVHARSGCVFGIAPNCNISTNYNRYYADVEEWISNPGYVDYICPQIYFGFKNSTSPFDVQAAAWAGMKRHSSVSLYVGLALYKTGVAPDNYAGEGKQEWVQSGDIMKRQVELLRTLKSVGGVMLYNFSGLNADTRSAGSGQSYSADIGRKELENLLPLFR